MALTDEDKTWIKTELERVETSLLTELQKWASPVEARQRHDASLGHVSAILEVITNRLDLITIRLESTGQLVDRLVASQAQTEAMLRDLIQAITRERSNGKPAAGDEA